MRIIKKGWQPNRFLIYLGVMFLLMVTTQIVSKKLIADYESQVTICHPKLLDTTQTYYNHVLGAGYSLDPKLPATSQLSPLP